MGVLMRFCWCEGGLGRGGTEEEGSVGEGEQGRFGERRRRRGSLGENRNRNADWGFHGGREREALHSDGV